MKIKFIPLFILALNLLTIGKTYSQEKTDEFEPVYITVTTLHGAENVDMNEWKLVEEEFFNKVINKNDMLLAHEILVNYFSPELNEIKIINVYKNWEDIEKVWKQRSELVEKAWPDEEEREAFFQKQNSFYSNFHSEEIYKSTRFTKHLSKETNKDKALVFYIKTNILSDYEDENEESYDAYKNYVKNIIQKNPYIKAYYPYRHYVGADSREFVEVTVVSSLMELEKSLNKNKELIQQLFPDKEKQKEFKNSFGKAITSQSNAIYLNVPSLSKR